MRCQTPPACFFKSTTHPRPTRAPARLADPARRDPPNNSKKSFPFFFSRPLSQRTPNPLAIQPRAWHNSLTLLLVVRSPPAQKRCALAWEISTSPRAALPHKPIAGKLRLHPRYTCLSGEKQGAKALPPRPNQASIPAPYCPCNCQMTAPAVVPHPLPHTAHP
ncbi:hypothetical protein EXIGLDRAFT_97774 [Exidia glandulosa HHB12029]|uniref:Uncharacterized protein n=1 Tax=Exidia glandulosa HHB12029 TaxID=1314781 RepID=A0A165H263_EXIGL|nr:hypothetical protein EXIGLDRAFT_97774 [Exidia glandulosa HHB12029]